MDTGIRTSIVSQNIRDGDVKRADLNTSISGSAVIRRAVAGDSVELSSTGADSGTGDVTIHVIPQVITMVGASITWSNMPSALTELMGSGRLYYRTKADLSHATKARIVVRVTTAGANGFPPASLAGQYSLNESTWYYLDGSSGPYVSIGSTGTIVSSWITLTGNAQDDVYLRIVGKDGNGTADPVFGLITLQFK